MPAPRFTDHWARSGRRYTPAAATDVARTIRRARAEQRAAGENPLDPRTWTEQQPEHTLNTTTNGN